MGAITKRRRRYTNAQTLTMEKIAIQIQPLLSVRSFHGKPVWDPKYRISYAKTLQIVELIFAIITKKLQRKERVVIMNFGTFFPHTWKEHYFPVLTRKDGIKYEELIPARTVAHFKYARRQRKLPPWTSRTPTSTPD